MSDLVRPVDKGHLPQRGFIVFCETKLCYEGGWKALVFLVPYLAGAVGLEMAIYTRPSHALPQLAQWLGMLAYLVLFPSLWRRVLKLARGETALTH